MGYRFTTNKCIKVLLDTLYNYINNINSINLLDLYSGSGLVSCYITLRYSNVKNVFCVEKNIKYIRLIRKNINKFNLFSVINIVHLNIFKFLKLKNNIDYDIIFIDPPYNVSNYYYNNIIKNIIYNNFLKKNCILIIEHFFKKLFVFPDYLFLLVKKRIGQTCLSFFILK